MKQYRIYLLLLAGLLIFIAYLAQGIGDPGRNLDQTASRLGRQMTATTSDIHHTFSQVYFSEHFAQKRLTKEEVVRLNKLPYELLIYLDDSLLFWSSNAVIPSQHASAIDTGTSMQKFRNGYYLVTNRVFKNKHGRLLTMLAVVPLKYDYQTPNRYLQNVFGSLFPLPAYLAVSNFERAGYRPVTLTGGKVLFYLGVDQAARSETPSMLALLFFILGLLMLIFFLNHLVNRISSPLHPVARPAILGCIFFLVVEVLAHKSWLPAGVVNWSIFDPVYFASGAVATSLGSLVIALAFLVWICLNLNNHFFIRLKTRTGSFYNYIAFLISYLFIFVLGIYCVVLVQALVRDSKIDFSFLNPSDPDPLAIIAVFCIAWAMFCLFMISEKVVSLLQPLSLRLIDRIIVLLIAVVLATTIFIQTNVGLSGMYLMPWLCAYVLLLPFFRMGKRGGINFTRLVLLLVFFAASGAALLSYYSGEKRKETKLDFAHKLVNTRDAVTEFLLTSIKDRIANDAYVRDFFKGTVSDAKELHDRLRQHYFSAGFNRYNIRFYAFDSSGILLRNLGDDFGYATESGITSRMQSIGSDSTDLYYTSSTTGDITYMAAYNILSGDTLFGRLFVSLQTDPYKNAGVYPQLLLSEKDKPPLSIPAFSYAVYNRGHLIDHHGDFNYSFVLDKSLSAGQDVQYTYAGGYDHLWYRPQANIVIAVTQKNTTALYFLSFFSFLFLVMFVIALAVTVVNAIVNNTHVLSFRELLGSASMRALIHGFFMLFILLILFVTGFVTGRFFLRQFNELAVQTVRDKMSRVAEQTQFLAEDYLPDSTDQSSFAFILNQNLMKLAEVQDNEINFYDRSGVLITSTQPSVFEKGIISQRMNPVAFYELRREKKTTPVNEEHIGKLAYYSGYQAIRRDDGRLMGYVNLPYYDSGQQLNEQVGFFFVMLVNILVIATIIAGLLAPFISRQITAKLSVISNQLQKIRLGAPNELIEWKANDEIGSLVQEYNKMIVALEKSTEELKRTEKLDAWKVMARQVAHEIKNPLTPMKLKIQLLQRAYEENNPDLKALQLSTTHMLIEQIDALSKIANDFSNFAMFTGEFARVSVHEVLATTAELHGGGQAVHVHLHAHAAHDTVMGDRKQLLVIFNNLVINAIQAIPQERQGEINIVTSNEAQQLLVAITDNGMGINSEERDHVFDLHFSTKTSGTGLGLATSKKFVEGMGGKIYFTSQPGQGTTFYVELPLAGETELS